METTVQAFSVSHLDDELTKVMQEKAETEFDIRQSELAIKKINAKANLEKAKLEFMKLQLEQKRMEMEERRLTLEEIQAKYNIASDLAAKSVKLQHIVGKTMLGIFPKEDKQIAQIMDAANKVAELEKEK